MWDEFDYSINQKYQNTNIIIIFIDRRKSNWYENGIKLFLFSYSIYYAFEYFCFSRYKMWTPKLNVLIAGKNRI